MSSSIPVPTDTLTVKDIVFTHGEIFKVVDDFYNRIQRDPVLQVPFQSVHDWPEHIDRITHFWWIRMGGQPYQFSEYNPVPKHYFAGFNRELLKRWLGIFNDTLKDNLTPSQAVLWLLIAETIGRTLTAKNDLFEQTQKNKVE